MFKAKVTVYLVFCIFVGMMAYSTSHTVMKEVQKAAERIR